MLQLSKNWLEVAPWQVVTSLNQSLCQARELASQPNEKGFEPARQLWEESGHRPLTLFEALDLCRRCHDLMPFTFNNGNTFAGIGRTLLDDWLQTLPSVEAQIVRNTVGHYIVSLIDKRELHRVFRHFETTWRIDAK